MDAAHTDLHSELLEPETTAGEQLATWIISVSAGLMSIGAIMTFSASISVDHPALSWPVWETPSLRQLLFVVAGLAAMLVMMKVPYRIWLAGRGWFALAFLLISLAAAALVFVPGLGVQVKGARRWITLTPNGMRFQPSELAKLSVVMFLGCWLALRVDVRKFFKGLLPTLLAVGLCIALIGIEDFGTAALLAAVSGGMLIVAGARWTHLIGLVLPVIPAFGYLLFSQPYRVERLMIFLDPWQDASASGYQVIQSLCTIANGGWLGQGLGNGFNKGYLPEAHNDFIFAVICEELGVVGASAVILMILMLLWLGRLVLLRTRNNAARLIVFGIILTIGMQAAMNIAVVTAAVPTKGIALPLVSAGGSGTVVLGAMVGILANIARSSSFEVDER